jgi:hypothetical protein
MGGSTTTSKNLGLVSAIKMGLTPPSNRNLMWIDTNTTPAKKKLFDFVSQLWLEIVFSAESNTVNSSKKQIIKKTGSVDAIITLSNEDIFIKTTELELDTFVTLPTPSASNEGKMYECVNLTVGQYKIMYDKPIYSVNDVQVTEQLELNWRIVCTFWEQANSYKWILINGF